MEDLDKKINLIIRDKISYMLAENSVRIKKVNTRYTNKNLYNTVERLNDIVGSYDRLVRTICKERFSVEKAVRLRYISELTPERLHTVKRETLNEVERGLRQLTEEYKKLYKPFAKEAEFDEQVEKIFENAKENIEKLAEKTLEKINSEVVGSTRVSPDDLQNLYDIEQSSLVDLAIIKPLQNMHLMLARLSEKPEAQSLQRNIQEAIKEYVKISKSNESDAWAIPSVQGKKMRKMEVAGQDIFLKDMIYGLHSLIQNAELPAEHRNREVIDKIWKQIELGLDAKESLANVKQNLKTLYDLL
ncbi:MAG: hypothetical protein G3M78_10685 [Candidatus Nitrohelix vancouverensis]|uniref:Uncharacterized protein n=1 Tax=Candidatus Nitrohelix vancouverensis TaxID=2705534 RepID=A0A7T0C3E3_9BACT|nr:MAG: hypothetical protein G3M78_10685 [Candidatus Nitrohelix vancouverensis]